MSNTIGGTFSYLVPTVTTKEIKLNDFNAKFTFNRPEAQNSNTATVVNGNTTVAKGNNSKVIKVNSNAEYPTLQHIFSLDNDSNTFSQSDLSKLMANIGKTIKVDNNKSAYKVEQLQDGKIRLNLREVLADGSTRSIGASIDIDVSKELQEKTGAELNVNWFENGEVKNKHIKFKEDFGFNINGDTYKTQNGVVYDQNNRQIYTLNLSKRVAYQFIGMSNIAENTKDYTFSSKDIKEAMNQDVKLGSGAGRLSSSSSDGKTFKTKCEYTTSERHLIFFTKEETHSNTVSVWTINK